MIVCALAEVAFVQWSVHLLANRQICVHTNFNVTYNANFESPSTVTKSIVELLKGSITKRVIVEQNKR